MLGDTARQAEKSNELTILLKKLKEVFESKFRDLELDNQILNKEIQGSLTFCYTIKT